VYEVELHRNVRKTLDKLQEQERLKLASVLLKLEKDPRPRGVEKVRGTELWRIREGDYRVVYHIDDESKVVAVVRIGHRRDIYRDL
jgi:mRNA interferase RelE/StbE